MSSFELSNSLIHVDSGGHVDPFDPMRGMQRNGSCHDSHFGTGFAGTAIFVGGVLLGSASQSAIVREIRDEPRVVTGGRLQRPAPKEDRA